jgi:hypothetical protein
VIGKLVGERIEAIVVDLEFQLLVEAVEHFRMDAVVDRMLAVGRLFGHGKRLRARCGLTRYFQTQMSVM